ncbi:MAG: molybdenum cofactor guanylyltransferase [Lachnospiraceae bacterium]|nr:molybdenum cofactor guanylyltransferase [Lachnospiraceae bacterium]
MDIDTGINRYKTAAAVLVGGRSVRMGRPKENVVIDGDGRTFLEKVCCEIDRAYLSGVICKRYLSVRKGQETSMEGYVRTEDAFDGIGPLAGLISVLKRARSDGAGSVIILACDMIGYTYDELTGICRAYKGEDILWARTRTGFIEPLGSIYSVNILEKAIELAESGRYRLKDLEGARTVTGYYDSASPVCYENINSL